MDRLAQLLTDGITNGAVYAIVALALVLVFRSTGMVNLAQGEMATLATFVGWQCVSWGLPVALAITAAGAAGFVTGIVVYLALIRPLHGSSDLTIVIVTLGVFLISNSSSGLIWGTDVRAFPTPFTDDVWSLGSVRVTASALGVVAVLALTVLALSALFRYTRVGLAMRAAAFNPESARLSGVRVNRMLMLGWGLAATLGAVSGTLVAPKLFLDPNMMFPVLFYAIAAATVGGLRSPLGAVVGGVLIGVTESLAGSYIGWIGSDLKIVVPIVLIVIVLLVRPEGLFGRREVTRV